MRVTEGETCIVFPVVVALTMSSFCKFPLPYNLDSPCFVHTLTCNLTLTSYFQDLLLCKIYLKVFVIRSVSLSPYYLGSPHLVHTLMKEPEGTVSWYIDLI